MPTVKSHPRKGRRVKPHYRKHPKRNTAKFKNKMHKVMGEFKDGTLHSGSSKGPIVGARKQAIAIGLSVAARAMRKKKK